MKDTSLKSLLGLLLRNKKLIWDITDHFKADDLERGIVAIPHDLINRDLKMLIMEKTDPYLADYLLLFENGTIYCNLDLVIKQLGKIRAKYMLVIEEFTFNSQAHIIQCTYKEDVRSDGNFVQNMALKAAGLKGSYLQTVATFLKLDYIEVNESSFTIYLDKIDGFHKIPPELQLEYTGCNDGILSFKFNIL